MRDRYSITLPAFAMGLFLVFLGFSLMGVIGVKRGWLIIGIGLLLGFPAVLVGMTPARFHFYIEGMRVKGERGGFREVDPNKPPYKGDGVCIKKNGKYRRYKAVNGADICLQDGELVPCGWGSCFMQQIGCGGWEVPSIQGKEAWECPKKGH